MKDTIDMAREAGKHQWPLEHDFLKRFEALIRADEREKHKWDVHSCGPTCEKYACVALREAVEAEREAIARWLEGEKNAPYWAELVRARGKT